MPRPRSPLSTVLAAVAFTATLAMASVSQAKPRTHTVYSGQTLGMIAKRYNVTVEALRNANDLKVGRPIKPKQELIIPDRDDKDGSRARELKRESQARDDRPTKGASTKADRRDDRRERTAKTPATSKSSATDFARKPRRRGYVVLQGSAGRWQGLAVTRRGKIPEAARRGFEKVLASWRTGTREKIDERLIRMLIRVSDHFGGRPIRIVSGYRPWSAAQHTPHSRHNLGQAIDFSIPGVPNTVVRDYCRSLRRVGVGYYPNSSFVHLDVRDTKTYWVDYSGPGEPPRYAHGRNGHAGWSGSTIPASMSRPIGGHDSSSSGSVDTQARPKPAFSDLQ